jgi:hypothetical protein
MCHRKSVCLVGYGLCSANFFAVFAAFFTTNGPRSRAPVPEWAEFYCVLQRSGIGNVYCPAKRPWIPAG